VVHILAGRGTQAEFGAPVDVYSIGKGLFGKLRLGAGKSVLRAKIPSRCCIIDTKLQISRDDRVFATPYAQQICGGRNLVIRNSASEDAGAHPFSLGNSESAAGAETK